MTDNLLTGKRGEITIGEDSQGNRWKNHKEYVEVSPGEYQGK